MKTGLIMEGGAMRGIFTAGVMDVLMENNISFDGAIGVSAGAAFGCNIKSKQIGRVLRYNKRFSKDPRFISIRSLVKTGDLIGADFCYNQIPNVLDKFDYTAYRENPMDFYVVCTDVFSGKPIYKNCLLCDEAELKYIRASASLPCLSKPVKVDNFTLLDGGISDSIPLSFFESIGYTKNILILTQTKDFKKEKNKALFIMKPLLRKYPEIYNRLKNRHNDYNKTLKEIEKAENEKRIFVIRPPEKLPISRLEKNCKKIDETYKIGRKTALDNLEAIKSFLRA